VKNAIVRAPALTGHSWVGVLFRNFAGSEMLLGPHRRSTGRWGCPALSSTWAERVRLQPRGRPSFVVPAGRGWTHPARASSLVRGGARRGLAWPRLAPRGSPRSARVRSPSYPRGEY